MKKFETDDLVIIVRPYADVPPPVKEDAVYIVQDIDKMCDNYRWPCECPEGPPVEKENCPGQYVKIDGGWCYGCRFRRATDEELLHMQFGDC